MNIVTVYGDHPYNLEIVEEPSITSRLALFTVVVVLIAFSSGRTQQVSDFSDASLGPATQHCPLPHTR